MSQIRETNPHFQPRVQRYTQPHDHDPDGLIIPVSQVPRRDHDPDGLFIPASQVPRRDYNPDGLIVPASQVPQRFRPSPPFDSPTPVVPLLTHPQQPNSHLPASSISSPTSEPYDPVPTSIPPKAPRNSRPPPTPYQSGGVSHYPSPPLRVPPPRKTKRLTWLVAICCALFWILIILGGLILLIVYLAYRPHYPKFDISNASLNTAYLDLGYLLNGDMTLLANFTNPNKKVNVEFHYVVINLYFEGKLIAARYVEPLSVSKRSYELRDVHMVSSQIPFSRTHVAHLNEQIRTGRVLFQVRSFLRATSNLGGFFRYSYWLHGRCDFTVSSPPSGTLVAKKCVTKR